MQDVRRQLSQAIIAVFFAAPWVWLACFAIFTAAVTIAVGHFPSYSNPDPKHVAGLEPLYLLTVLLLLPLALSPLVMGAHAGSLLWRGMPLQLQRTGTYLLGCALEAAILFGDAFGLANWLYD
jgi:hypothetical protein